MSTLVERSGLTSPDLEQKHAEPTTSAVNSQQNMTVAARKSPTNDHLLTTELLLLVTLHALGAFHQQSDTILQRARQRPLASTQDTQPVKKGKNQETEYNNCLHLPSNTRGINGSLSGMTHQSAGM